jgi:hypothetical protein
MQMIFSRSIDPIPQFTATLKSHDLPCWQHLILTSGRIPAFTFRFLLYTEFTEPTDQDIFTSRKGILYNANGGFNNICTLFMCQVIVRSNTFEEISFG